MCLQTIALTCWVPLSLQVLKSACYLTVYYAFAQPRAVIWQMYLVTVAIVYCCTGTAYLLSFVRTLPDLVHCFGHAVQRLPCIVVCV
jgi:hypothetical protein